MPGPPGQSSPMFLLFRDLPPGDPDELELTAEESRHVKARRLGPGDAVYIGDGRGTRWRGRLEDRTRWVRERDAPPMRGTEPERWLCTALPEGRRWDWLLQKATELGVTRVRPVNFRRSERRDVNLDRAPGVMREAASQARRFILPAIDRPVDLASLLAAPDLPATFYWLHNFDSPAEHEPVGRVSSGDPAALLVGPEGGFAPEEVALLRARAEIREICLGMNVMRVETAGIAMLARLLDARVW